MFENYKSQFEALTGKKANDNLEAYFTFLNTLVLLDIKDNIKVIRFNQPKPNAGL